MSQNLVRLLVKAIVISTEIISRKYNLFLWFESDKMQQWFSFPSTVHNGMPIEKNGHTKMFFAITFEPSKL